MDISSFSNGVIYNDYLNNNYGVIRHVVKFNTNGGSTIGNVLVNDGGIVNKQKNPTKFNYTFEGWYLDSNLLNCFDFNTKITKDIVLYVKWENNKGIDIRNNKELNSVKDSKVFNYSTVVHLNNSKPTFDIQIDNYAWNKDNLGNWKLSTYYIGGKIVNYVECFVNVESYEHRKLNGKTIECIGKSKYYFDGDGSMVIGWLKTHENNWYFFNNEDGEDKGKMVIGWKEIDNKWYYFGKDRIMYVNRTISDGNSVDEKWRVKAVKELKIF